MFSSFAYTTKKYKIISENNEWKNSKEANETQKVYKVLYSLNKQKNIKALFDAEMGNI